MPNIEIKAKYADANKAKAIADKLKAKYLGTDHQIDTYFKTSEGRFKLRESSLSGAQLVPYIRPDVAGPKKSDYLVIPVADANLCKSLLSQILGVDIVVDKMRDIFLIDNVRVHIDSVKDVGSFLEFEAVYQNLDEEKQEYEKVELLIKKFEIRPEDLLTGSYREIVCAKNGKKS